MRWPWIDLPSLHSSYARVAGPTVGGGRDDGRRSARGRVVSPRRTITAAVDRDHRGSARRARRLRSDGAHRRPGRWRATRPGGGPVREERPLVGSALPQGTHDDDPARRLLVVLDAP